MSFSSFDKVTAEIGLVLTGNKRTPMLQNETNNDNPASLFCVLLNKKINA